MKNYISKSKISWIILLFLIFIVVQTYLYAAEGEQQYSCWSGTVCPVDRKCTGKTGHQDGCDVDCYDDEGNWIGAARCNEY